MGKKASQTPGPAGVQVFELTMDNPEDQDELNRQLQKPGEPYNSQSAMIGHKVQVESTTASVGKKKKS